MSEMARIGVQISKAHVKDYLFDTMGLLGFGYGFDLCSNIREQRILEYALSHILEDA